jgi:phospholipase/carboxylesterase
MAKVEAAALRRVNRRLQLAERERGGADSRTPLKGFPAQPADISAAKEFSSAPLIAYSPAAPELTDSLLVFLHGRGDIAQNWAETVRVWLAPAAPNAEIVLPQAPPLLEHGPTCFAWYRPYDEESRAESVARLSHDVHALAQQRDVALSRVVVAGFSQGASLAMHAVDEGALHTIGGVLAWGGYLDEGGGGAPQRARTAHSPPPPILMLHGGADTSVPPSRAEASCEAMRSRGLRCCLRVYQGLGHALCVDQLEASRAWLREILPPLPRHDER